LFIIDRLITVQDENKTRNLPLQNFSQQVTGNYSFPWYSLLPFYGYNTESFFQNTRFLIQHQNTKMYGGVKL